MRYNRFFDSATDKKLVCSCGKCGFGTKPGDVDPLVIMLATCARLHFKAAVTITSGPRCPAYNALPSVQGASKSYHLPKDERGNVVASGGVCHALDISVKGVKPRDVYDWFCATWPDKYGFGDGSHKGFTHIDTRPGKAARFNY